MSLLSISKLQIRWTHYPAIVTITLYALLYLQTQFMWTQDSSPSWLLTALDCLKYINILAIFLSYLLSYLFPLQCLLPPSGPYAVSHVDYFMQYNIDTFKQYIHRQEQSKQESLHAYAASSIITTMKDDEEYFQPSIKNGTWLRIYYPTQVNVSAMLQQVEAMRYGNKDKKSTLSTSHTSTTTTSPYFKHGHLTATAFANFAKMPSIIFSHLPMLKVNMSFMNPMASNTSAMKVMNSNSTTNITDQFPVIIFSHGLGGTPEVYSQHILELASQGYVVMAPLHTDASATRVQFPDGTILPYRPLSNHELTNQAYPIRNAQLKHRVAEILSVVEFIHQHLDKKVDVSAAAASAIHHAHNHMDSVSLQHMQSLFAGKLDLKRIATCGHSFGGVTSLQSAFYDARIQVAMGLDTWYFPINAQILHQGLQKPVLLSTSQEFRRTLKENTERLHRLLKHSPQTFCYVLKNSSHHSYNDFPSFSPHVTSLLFKSKGLTPDDAIRLTNRSLLSFLSHYFLEANVKRSTFKHFDHELVLPEHPDAETDKTK